MFVELSNDTAAKVAEILAATLDTLPAAYRPEVEGVIAELRPALDLILVTEDPADLDEGDAPRRGLRCPHCQGVTWDGHDEGIRVVDIAVRWNTFGYDAEGECISGSYDADADFEGDHYACESCGGKVSLPAEIEESGW